MEKQLPEENNVDSYNFSSRITLTDLALPEKNGKGNETNEDYYNPFSHRDMTHATSSLGSFFHMLKSSLGTGILAMPNAFKHGGLVFSAVGTCLIGILCTHCVNMLVNCSQVLSTRVKKPTLDYGETAAVAFETGPRKFRHLSSFSREFVHATLFATYFFGPCAYFIFISRSLEQVMENHYHFGLKTRMYILISTIAIFPISMIRTLKNLVPFSAAATVFITFGLSLTLYYTFTDLPDITTREYIGAPTKLPLFYSTVLFAMEGIGTVLPIENSMKRPDQFLGCPGVLNIAMVIVVLLYATVGFFGYWRFGPVTDATLTLNLSDSLLAESVKILVALSVLFTYGLQVNVAVAIVWKKISPRLGENKQEVGYYFTRGTVILLAVLTAFSLPTLSPFISLVGAVCFSVLGFFIPAVIEIVTFWEDDNRKWWIWKNIFVIFTSLFSLVSGSYASIIEIIEAYRNNEI